MGPNHRLKISPSRPISSFPQGRIFWLSGTGVSGRCGPRCTLFPPLGVVFGCPPLSLITTAFVCSAGRGQQAMRGATCADCSPPRVALGRPFLSFSRSRSFAQQLWGSPSGALSGARTFCPPDIAPGSPFRPFVHPGRTRLRPGSARRRGGSPRRPLSGRLRVGGRRRKRQQGASLRPLPSKCKRVTTPGTVGARLPPRWPAHLSPRPAAASARHAGPPKSLATCDISRQGRRRHPSRSSRGRPPTPPQSRPAGVGPAPHGAALRVGPGAPRAHPPGSAPPAECGIAAARSAGRLAAQRGCAGTRHAASGDLVALPTRQLIGRRAPKSVADPVPAPARQKSEPRPKLLSWRRAPGASSSASIAQRGRFAGGFPAQLASWAPASVGNSDKKSGGASAAHFSTAHSPSLGGSAAFFREIWFFPKMSAPQGGLSSPFAPRRTTAPPPAARRAHEETRRRPDNSRILAPGASAANRKRGPGRGVATVGRREVASREPRWG